ncbi:hypothetical protein ACFQ7M_12145 [Streptomyces massasporeus]
MSLNLANEAAILGRLLIKGADGLPALAVNHRDTGKYGAVRIVSENANAPALAVQGTGNLLEFRNGPFDSPVLTIGHDGAITSSGTLKNSGPLVISAVDGAPDPSTLPVGGTSKAENTGIMLVSSFAGGEDNSSGTDTTARLNFYSYQRASTHSFGEVQRMYAMRRDSKQMLAWYGYVNPDRTPGYDPVTRNPAVGATCEPIAWIGAHIEANDHASMHNHISIEVPDSTGALQTRFEILLGDRTTGTIGLDKTFIITNDADFAVRQSGGESFRVVAPAGTEKRIEFMGDAFGSDSSRRWKIRSNSTAETGANAGSDFQIVRYDDLGVVQDSPIEITRSSGQVKLGPTGGVLVTRATGVALQVTPTATGGQGILTTGTDTTARAYQGNVSGDANIRYVAYVDGKQEWGPGTSARDTNLYRSAASTLTTDDLFTAVGVTSTTAGTTAAATFATSADGTASLGTVVINPFSTSKRALDVRLVADSSSRLRFDFSAASGNGTISFGDGTNTDVNLYRNAANVLKTDDKLVAALGLGVGNSASATTLGAVTRKIEVFDASGASLGFLAVYNAIS